jgi:two-component system phosphate regulon response regulator PhoB
MGGVRANAYARPAARVTGRWIPARFRAGSPGFTMWTRTFHPDFTRRQWARRVRELGSRAMPGDGHLVLIVDDEPDLRTLLELNLRRAEYRTVQAAGGYEALRRVESHAPDLIVLDLNLPDLPGTEVCRRLKTDPRTEHIPIVMLTARGAEADRIAGFELGAEDYLVKPFSIRELILRLDVVRRRGGAKGKGAARRVYQLGALEVDAGAFSAAVGGQRVTLALLEFRLLVYLLEAEGRVRTREELLRDIWGYPADSESRTIETHVKRLRAKLGAAGELIETVRSVGYRVAPGAWGRGPATVRSGPSASHP